MSNCRIVELSNRGPWRTVDLSHNPQIPSGQSVTNPNSHFVIPKSNPKPQLVVYLTTQYSILSTQYPSSPMLKIIGKQAQAAQKILTGGRYSIIHVLPGPDGLHGFDKWLLVLHIQQVVDGHKRQVLIVIFGKPFQDFFRVLVFIKIVRNGGGGDLHRRVAVLHGLHDMGVIRL